MKFQCDHCGTRYTLSDEKIRNKVLKIRCKVCENIMVVRDPNAGRSRPVLQTPAPVQDDRTQLSAPLGEAFDAEWYVAAAGMQQGPMPVERLIADLRRGAVGPDDLVWNATMDEWQPARSLPILAGGIQAAQQPPALVRSGSDDEEETVIQNAPSLFDLGPAFKPAGERLASEVSAAVNAIHPVDVPGTPDDDVDTTHWPALPNTPSAAETLEPSRPAAPEPPRPAPEPPRPAAPSASKRALESSKPEMISPELSEAPPIPDFSTQAPAVPADSTPVPASPAMPDDVDGDQASWMASLTDHLEVTPEAAAAPQIHAITKAAPNKKSKAPLVVLLLLLLVGVAAAVFWPTGADPVAPDQGVPVAVVDAAPVVDASVPDAAPKPVDAAVDAVVDAVVDASVPDAKPKKRKTPSSAASKPKPPKTPKTDASKRKPRSGLAALDKGKGSNAVELKPTTAPIEILPETLTKGQLQVVLTRGRTGVQACYQRQLKRDPSMKGGKVTIKFSVEGTGRAAKVRMERQYNGTVLKTCISSLVRRWRFPRFTGEPIPVEYPVFFQRAM
jgi:predicted Zn finger-like uncharacterized protein